MGRIGERLDTEVENESSKEGGYDSYTGTGNPFVTVTGQKRHMAAFLSGKKENWIPC